MPITLKSISSLFKELVRDFLEHPEEPPPDVDGYDITRRIGKGGMGAVYLARDTTLDSDVAIKFISGPDADDPDVRDRFLREARAMAAVRHPNIVHVYGFGEAGGRPYIVMEYVDGGSLADRLRERGPLPPDAALWIVHQTVVALAAAWERGLVHRDVKPSNILLGEKDWVHVCDFGLARPAVGDLSSMTTQSGNVAGTPHYMSPEQASGKPMDFRSDIYSLGVVLYEMLAGEPPFTGETPEQLVARHLHEPLPELGDTARRRRWSKLASLVRWMTEKAPPQRPASYDELLEHVDGLIEDPTLSVPSVQPRRRRRRRKRALIGAGAGAAVVAVGALVVWQLGLFAPSPTIAVFPFDYAGDEPELQRIGMIVALDLTAEIQRARGTWAVPLETVLGLDEEPSAEAASLLSADWVVDGTVTHAGDDLRFTFDLMSREGRTASDRVHSGPRGELEATLAGLADQIFAVLEISVDRGRDTGGWMSPSFEALDLFAAATELESRWDERGSLEAAADLYRRATTIHPDWAPARARLAMALFYVARDTGDSSMLTEARSHAERAFNLRPDLPESNLAMGMADVTFGQTGLAEARFREALRLAPGNDAALRRIADLYAETGRGVDADATYRLAIELRPNYWENHYDRARYELVYGGNLELARAEIAEVLRLRPDAPAAVNAAAVQAYMAGDWEGATESWVLASEMSPGDDSVKNNLGFAYYATGRFELALGSWQAALDLEPERPLYHANVADALQQLGRKEEARAHYEEALSGFDELQESDPLNSENMAYMSMVLGALGDCERANELADEAVGRNPGGWIRYYALVTACRCDDTPRIRRHALDMIEAGEFLPDLSIGPDFEQAREIPEVSRALETATSGS